MKTALILALALTVLAAASAQELEGPQRTLSQFRPFNSFPFARCKEYKPATQPYALEYKGTTDLGDSIVEHTYTIKYKGPNVQQAESKYDCYNKLEGSLHKIMMNVWQACEPAWDVAKRFVTVAGKRPSTVEWRNYPEGSTLQLSALKLNATTADGAEIKIRVSAPCDLLETFSVLRYNRPWAIFSESSAHTCCGQPSSSAA